MPDPVTDPAVSTPIAVPIVLPNNSNSTEFKLATLNHYVGIAMIVVGILYEGISSSLPPGPVPHWVGGIVAALGTILKIGTFLGYNSGRAAVKAASAAAKTGAAALLIVGGLLFARPAYAQTPPVDSGLTIRLSNVLAIRPVVGISLIRYSFRDQTIAGSLSPNVFFELDWTGNGGPCAGWTLVVDKDQHPNLGITLGVSFHPPALAGTPIAHTVLAYQWNALGGPVQKNLVLGPAFAF